MSEEIRFSLSSEEDVNDFLSQLGYIHEGKDKDDEMLSIYLDFVKVLEKMDENDCLKLYHDIQIGLKERNHKITIEEQCAKELRISKEEFVSRLNNEIQQVVEIKKQIWIDYINSKYKNVYWEESFKGLAKETKLETNLSRYDGREDNEPNERSTGLVLTKEQKEQRDRDLLPLIEFEKELENEIDKLTKEGLKDSKECRRLVSYRIELRKDINIIRRHYGEVIGSQNSSGKRTFVTYGEDNPYFNEILKTHEKRLEEMKMDSLNEFLKVEKIDQIKKVAKNTLTNRQYIIFELYYFNELTHQEIADVMGDSRVSITLELQRIIKKIREKFGV